MTLLCKPPVYLWLDDERPAPTGWRWVKTVADAVAVMESEDVEAASLDHDLSDFAAAGGTGERRERTGYDFCLWMAEHGRWPAQKPVVHSMNPVGRERMKATIDRFWHPPSRKPVGDVELLEHFLRELDQWPSLLTQAARAREVWAQIKATCGVWLMTPMAYCDEAGPVTLAWNPHDLRLTLEVECLPDGRLDWFFRDGATDFYEGNEEPVAELPEAFFAHLRRFVREP